MTNHDMRERLLMKCGKMWLLNLRLFFILIWIVSLADHHETCPKKQAVCTLTLNNTRYLFYEVNHAEGFNLRRDVYMRLAIFMHNFNEKNWKLVLPHWPRLYHWRSGLAVQDHLPWSAFFEVPSLQQFAPVIELHQLFDDMQESSFEIDTVFVLQHYKDAFTKENWSWQDRWSFEKCHKQVERMQEDRLWSYNNITAKSIKCVSFQGGASLLKNLLEQSDGRFVMIDHAEIMLHDNFGDRKYWQCRRSMQFANFLRAKANLFTKHELNHTKLIEPVDGTSRVIRNVKGGPYLCAHLRRRDFVQARADQVPTLEFAADQIQEILSTLNLNTVFIASDAPYQEILDLKKLLSRFVVKHYLPDMQDIIRYKDGGVAIIDQIICSNARYFIGTYESTYSFRIQEEREILGFPEETTFNRLCGSNENCEQPSRWKIQF